MTRNLTFNRAIWFLNLYSFWTITILFTSKYQEESQMSRHVRHSSGPGLRAWVRSLKKPILWARSLEKQILWVRSQSILYCIIPRQGSPNICFAISHSIDTIHKLGKFTIMSQPIRLIWVDSLYAINQPWSLSFSFN